MRTENQEEKEEAKNVRDDLSQTSLSLYFTRSSCDTDQIHMVAHTKGLVTRDIILLKILFSTKIVPRKAAHRRPNLLLIFRTMQQ